MVCDEYWFKFLIRCGKKLQNIDACTYSSRSAWGVLTTSFRTWWPNVVFIVRNICKIGNEELYNSNTKYSMCGERSLLRSMLSHEKLHFLPSFMIVSSIEPLEDGGTGAGSICV